MRSAGPAHAVLQARGADGAADSAQEDALAHAEAGVQETPEHQAEEEDQRGQYALRLAGPDRDGRVLGEGGVQADAQPSDAQEGVEAMGRRSSTALMFI